MVTSCVYNIKFNEVLKTTLKAVEFNSLLILLLTTTLFATSNLGTETEFN